MNPGGGTELHERHGYTNAHGPTAAIALHCTALCLHVHLNGYSQLEDDPLAMSGSRPEKRRRVLPATFSAFTAPQTACNEVISKWDGDKEAEEEENEEEEEYIDDEAELADTSEGDLDPLDKMFFQESEEEESDEECVDEEEEVEKTEKVDLDAIERDTWVRFCLWKLEDPQWGRGCGESMCPLHAVFHNDSPLSPLFPYTCPRRDQDHGMEERQRGATEGLRGEMWRRQIQISALRRNIGMISVLKRKRKGVLKRKRSGQGVSGFEHAGS